VFFHSDAKQPVAGGLPAQDNMLLLAKSVESSLIGLIEPIDHSDRRISTPATEARVRLTFFFSPHQKISEGD